MTDLLSRVEEQYARWRSAMTRRDVAWFERVEHEDFRYTGSDGTRKRKSDHIAQVTSALEAEFRTDIRTVDQYGDTVVVTGDHWARTRLDPSRAGLSAQIVRKMSEGISYAFTSVWLVTDGGFRLLAHHTSELPDT